MSNKKISVIVPIYNAEKHIENCIKSITEQTYQDLEIILVNDGSTDKSSEICKQYAAIDDRIVVIDKENGGVSSARNTGIEKSTGDFITFVDADDALEKDMYSYMICENKADSDIIQCAIFFDTKNESEIKFSPKADFISENPKYGRKFLKYYSAGCWCKLFKRDLLSQIRFSPDFCIGEDLLFCLDAAYQAGKILILKEPKYHYIQNCDSVCYSKYDEKKLVSYRNMLKVALKRAKGYNEIKKYLVAQNLKNNADMSSRITLGSYEGVDELYLEIKDEVKRLIWPALFSAYIPFMQKIKLILIGYFNGLYKKLLKAKKKESVR